MSYDLLFKFIIVGSAGTGKSSILNRFIEDQFDDSTQHTIGVEFASKVIQLGDKVIKLQIWDTAGQERFRSVTRSYYRGAAAAILVYDVTSRASFTALQSWLADTRELATHEIVIFLVGNKLDREAERQVSFLEASQFAQENELKFLETSAYTGDNVEQAFLTCARSILVKLDAGEIVTSTESGVLTNPSKQISDGWGEASGGASEGCSC